MTNPKMISPTAAVLKIWKAAEALFGTNAERPLQIVIGNAAPAGERFFFIGLLPGRSVPAFVPMESRIPLVVREEDPALFVEDCRGRLGRVAVLRGDIQEAEFRDLAAFLSELGVDWTLPL
jgi:hypothetical protein